MWSLLSSSTSAILTLHTNTLAYIPDHTFLIQIHTFFYKYLDPNRDSGLLIDQQGITHDFKKYLDFLWFKIKYFDFLWFNMTKQD